MSANDQVVQIHGLAREELAEFCARDGLPRFRAEQIWRWLYHNRVGDWEKMTNLPAVLRATLARTFEIRPVTVREAAGTLPDTVKLLVGLPDGEGVEEVLIPAPRRRTVCVSSQVGCRYGCVFCASGQAGFRRNLAAAEIVGQVLLAAHAWEEQPTHVVFMGIGEPLDNYDNVLKAIRILNDGDGLAIGARRITISSCGLVPAIRRLADEGLQTELSISLHAPVDAIRADIMPVNRRYPIAELLAACGLFAEKTKRIVTFEYTLIRGVNDSRRCAEALVRILRPLPCRVNLIALSAVAEYVGEPAPPAAAAGFLELLERAGINATLRASKGAGVKAACGQLRYRKPT